MVWTASNISVLPSNSELADPAGSKDRGELVMSNKILVQVLLYFFPRAANLLGPFFVTAPIIEFIGDRGVTAADPLRILRCGCCWFDRARFYAYRMVKRLRQSSRSFAVAHAHR
jgi:hypothetical protein